MIECSYKKKSETTINIGFKTRPNKFFGHAYSGISCDDLILDTVQIDITFDVYKSVSNTPLEYLKVIDFNSFSTPTITITELFVSESEPTRKYTLSFFVDKGVELMEYKNENYSQDIDEKLTFVGFYLSNPKSLEPNRSVNKIDMSKDNNIKLVFNILNSFLGSELNKNEFTNLSEPKQLHRLVHRLIPVFCKLK